MFSWRLINDLVGGILLFPVWWYTRGLTKVLVWIWLASASYREKLAIRVWLVNLFVPMYGSYDLAGRLISFFVRLVQIIVRSLLLVAHSVLLLVVLIAYLLLPPVSFWQFLVHLLGIGAAF